MERRARGDEPEAEARTLLARMRAGEVSADQLALAAHLGYPPARLLVPEAICASMKDWVAFLGCFEERARIAGRMALAIAERVLAENGELRDFDRDLPDAVAALAAWVDGRLSTAEAIAAAEAARDTAAGLEWLSYNAGPESRLPSATAASIVVECAEVPGDWTAVAWALQLSAIRLGQSFDDQAPPYEPLLRELGARLGPWALEAALTRAPGDPPGRASRSSGR